MTSDNNLWQCCLWIILVLYGLVLSFQATTPLLQNRFGHRAWLEIKSVQGNFTIRSAKKPWAFFFSLSPFRQEGMRTLNSFYRELHIPQCNTTSEKQIFWSGFPSLWDTVIIGPLSPFLLGVKIPLERLPLVWQFPRLWWPPPCGIENKNTRSGNFYRGVKFTQCIIAPPQQ